MPLLVRLFVASSLLLLLASFSGAVRAQGSEPPSVPVRRYAIVVGSNWAGGQDLETLHFADDDALNNCELLAQLGMVVSVFTRKDQQTRRRRDGHPHPFADQCSQPQEPHVQLIEKKLAQIADEVRARNDGARNVIVFWFSGHGSGSALFLENGPLSTERLRQLLLEPTQGHAEVHLILDSCDAREFVVGRKGDRRSMAQLVQRYPKGLNLQRYAHVGALIGATEFNKTQETSLLEAGVLSYELRAALRNGADATGDRKVTFQEAESFVWTANAGVDSTEARLFGQSFLPGGNDAVIADWTDPAVQTTPHVSISIPAEREVRFRVLDPRHVPIFETHKGRESDPSRTITAFLPANQAYSVEILGESGRLLDHRRIAASSGAQLWFDKLEREPISQRSKGVVESLQRGLFRRPFDARMFADYVDFKQRNPETAWYASREGDSESDAQPERRPSAWPYVLGGAGTAAVASGIVFNMLARSENEQARNLCDERKNDVCTVSSEQTGREVAQHLDLARTYRARSYVSLGIGGAALLGGMVLFASDSGWLSGSVSPELASVTFRGRF